MNNSVEVESTPKEFFAVHLYVPEFVERKLLIVSKENESELSILIWSEVESLWLFWSQSI